MKKYRLMKKNDNWYHLEIKTIWWPFWKYHDSGQFVYMMARFDAVITPTVIESEWIK